MRIIAVTACPTGIAHSQMAAENLETAGEELGHEIHVEIQGAMGTENEISDDDVAAADVVIVASDTTVRTDRFGDTPVVKGAVKDAVNDAEGMIREAEERVEEAGGAAGGGTADQPDAESGAEPDAPTTESTDAGAASTDAGATTTDAGAATTDAGAESAEATAGGDQAGGERRSSTGAADDRDDRQGLVGKLKSLFS